MSKTIEYKVFDEKAWKYNVDRFFFVFFLGVLIKIVGLFLKDFQEDTFLMLISFCFQWGLIIIGIGMLEGLFGLITKIALNPGIIIDSKFTVLKVFYKGLICSIMNFFKGFKQINYIKTIYLEPIDECYIGTYNGNLNGNYYITGYIKEPDHFKG